MNKNWIRRLCAATAVVMMALNSACAEEIPQLLEPVGVKLATAKAYVGSTSTLSAFSASIIPYTEDVCFEVSGVIDEIYATVGQTVKAGDPLLSLNQKDKIEQRETLAEEISSLETNLFYNDAIAKIDLDILHLELERLGAQLPLDDRTIELKKLEIEEFELNARLQRDLAQMNIDRLRNELNALDADLSRAVITAPFDGRVMFVASLQPGTRVNAFQPLIYLADDSQLFIESDFISESSLKSAYDLYALVDGKRLEVEPLSEDATEVMKKSLAGEKLTSRFSVVSDAELSAGQFATICMVTGYVEEALLIPTNALYATSSEKYVYVVENGVRIHRNVKTGHRNARETEILEGLEEGESVYVPD